MSAWIWMGYWALLLKTKYLFSFFFFHGGISIRVARQAQFNCLVIISRPNFGPVEPCMVTHILRLHNLEPSQSRWLTKPPPQAYRSANFGVGLISSRVDGEAAVEPVLHRDVINTRYDTHAFLTGEGPTSAHEPPL